jgi:hypothetical protein
MEPMQTRLQRKHDKDSMKQAGKYVLLTLVGLFALFKFGLPSLIKMAGFIGDLKSSGETIEKQDSLGPAQPILAALPEATSSGQITLSGYTEAGVKVTLLRDGIALADTISDTGGDFEFKNIGLKEGENNFYTVAEDNEANESDASRTYTVIFDNAKPELKVDEPEAGKRFFDADSPITVNGKTEAGSQLTLNGKFISVDGDGNFSSRWPLAEGDNQLDFLARDQAGNETKLNVVVNYTP